MYIKTILKMTTFYTYSPLSAYAGSSSKSRSRSSSRSESRSKSPLVHLDSKSQNLGVKYSTLAVLFLVLAIVFTWCHYVESKKSDAELKDRYGDGNICKFVMWCGSETAKYITWVLWVLFLVVVIPQANPIRETIM